MMDKCTYCGATAFYRDRESGALLCLAHARLEVVGPRERETRPSFTIRPAAAADRQAIAEMAQAFWGELEAECFGQTYLLDECPAFVASVGDEIVGTASYAREGETVTLVNLDVLPQWQGQGVARALIAALIEMARAESAQRVIVATANDNPLALALYQQLGFTITHVLVGRLLEHHGGVEFGFAGVPVRDEIQLELRL